MRSVPSKVLITGATGFIGGRLAERLAVEFGVRPRVLVRDVRRLSWLSRFPVEVVLGDVTDPASLMRAMEGIELVFHCAASGARQFEEAFKINVGGTCNVLEAARAADVSRVVHISTTAVHGMRLPSGVTEDSPLTPSPDGYARTKSLGEQKVWEFSQLFEFPVTVVRPALVYGPRSMTWTVGPARRLLTGTAVMVGDGSGIANLIYVDNLVDLLILAGTHPSAAGRAYFAADGEGITWRRFWEAHAAALGCPPPRSLPEAATKLGAAVSQRARGLATAATRLGRHRAGLAVALAAKAANRVVVPLDVLGGIPLDVYLNQVPITPARAARDLGFAPRVPFERGVADSVTWVRYHGYAETGD